MNVTSLFGGTSHSSVPIDSPIESTVRIPVNQGRIVWRLLWGIAVVVFGAYALIHQAMDYESRHETSLFEVIGKQDMSDVPADQRDIVKSVASYAGASEKFAYDYGRGWRMFVAVVALITGMLTIFREVARLQSTEPGLVVAPSGVIIQCECSHRIERRIGWPDIAAIEDRNYKGRAAVALRLRDPQRYLDEGSLLARLTRKSGDARVVVAPQSLQIGKQDLKTLLVRYFDAYARTGPK